MLILDRCYLFVDKKIVRPKSLSELIRWLAESSKERIVEQTDVAKNITVSTVFLVCDHNHSVPADKSFDRRPILFETMVFGGKMDGFQRQYRTYGEAKCGHFETLDKVHKTEGVVIETDDGP